MSQTNCWAGQWLLLARGQAPGMGSVQTPAPQGLLARCSPHTAQKPLGRAAASAPGVPHSPGAFQSPLSRAPPAVKVTASRPTPPLCSQGHRTEGTAWWLPRQELTPWSSLASLCASVPSFLFSGPPSYGLRAHPMTSFSLNHPLTGPQLQIQTNSEVRGLGLQPMNLRREPQFTTSHPRWAGRGLLPLRHHHQNPNFLLFILTNENFPGGQMETHCGDPGGGPRPAPSPHLENRFGPERPLSVPAALPPPCPWTCSAGKAPQFLGYLVWPRHPLWARVPIGDERLLGRRTPEPQVGWWLWSWAGHGGGGHSGGRGGWCQAPEPVLSITNTSNTSPQTRGLPAAPMHGPTCRLGRGVHTGLGLVGCGRVRGSGCRLSCGGRRLHLLVRGFFLPSEPAEPHMAALSAGKD